MSVLKVIPASQLKEKIYEKPIPHLDLLFDLLPENFAQAARILQLMDELVKEKKLDRHLLYKHMEEPLYFQDQSCQDFSRREPLIAKLVRDGGLTLLNHYLNYKYGSPLSAELLALHDIFAFNLAPIKSYIDNTNWPVFADKNAKIRIAKKYYTVFGMSYELFGDILQEKNMSILKRLVECKFDFNKQNNIDHLKKYLYINRDNHLQISDKTLQFLLQHGLNPESYLDLFLTGLWDQFTLPHATALHYPLVHLINFLLDHNATLSHFSREFLEKFHHTLEVHVEKIISLSPSEQQQQILEEMGYLQAQLMESTISFEAAKPYYFKVGKRGINAVRRKQLINTLEMIKSLSKAHA